MKKFVFSYIPLLFLLAICFLLTVTVHAQTLPSSVLIGDNEGIKVQNDGEYFVDVTDVMPGKNWYKKLTIQNTEKDVPYTLDLRISPAKVSGILDLSKAIQMKLTYEGQIVYEGPASGINETQNLQKTPLDLGTFASGDTRIFEVEYSLSDKYTSKDFAVRNKMENIWTFSAIKKKQSGKPDQPGTFPGTGSNNRPFGNLPMTNEQLKSGMLISLGLLIIWAVCLIIINRMKNKKEV